MAKRNTGDWTLTYNDWNPDQQPLREALCALGNGYLVTRAAAEEVSAGGAHYPGTYLAGGYNRLETDIAGRVIENEDLVNWPNWLCLTFRCIGEEWFHPDHVTILDYQQDLDVYQGLLTRRLRFRDRQERDSTLVSHRLVSMDQPHLAAIQWELTPENWSGEIEIRSTLDGAVQNEGVERYKDLNSQHLEVLDLGQAGENIIYLTVQTNQSHIRMAQAARTRVFQGDAPASIERHTHKQDGQIAQHLVARCEQHKPLRVEKVVIIHTSRDHAISSPTSKASKFVDRASAFAEIKEAHSRSWRHLWNRADIQLRGSDEETQFILRLHIFHLLQTTSVHSIDRDVGVPPRGWHGEAYRGHILWDELFIFPFLNLRIPELTRSLLMYRFRRLPEAKFAAQQAGYRGAMFPWQSGSDGREESQVLHLNPQSGRWIPDHSQIQRHVNIAIAYNIWQYYQATEDREFLSYYGAEMLLEIARFWASAAHYNPARDCYEIHGVMGPDEFHTGYPDADESGLKNNAYTNLLAVWVLCRACGILQMVAEDRRDELMEDLGLTHDELSLWNEISHKMFVPFHDEGIISQFEGYEDLREFDWEGYREKYGDIHRLDRILEAEGDDVNCYKAAKQADVLMLFYLLSCEELTELFERVGCSFEPEMIPRNIDYYLHRTAHGSTLSRVVHSWVLARRDRPRAWHLFKEALHSDIEDIQGGTTAEGIHLGAMAGSVDLILRGQTGIEMRRGVLWFNPTLPEELSEIQFRLRYRGHWLSVHVEKTSFTIAFERGWSEAVRIGVANQIVEMKQGEKRAFEIGSKY